MVCTTSYYTVSRQGSYGILGGPTGIYNSETRNQVLPTVRMNNLSFRSLGGQKRQPVSRPVTTAEMTSITDFYYSGCT
jgi:hypothetical protein